MTGELFSLEGRVAVVTGGSGVLGGGIARGLAAAGANVAVLGRRRHRAEAVAHEIAAAGGRALAVAADVTDRDAVEAAIGTAVDRLGGLDVLVNNAGTSAVRKLEALTDDDWQEQWDLHVMGPMRLMRASIPAMAEKGWGRVVNVVSSSGKRPSLTNVAYSVTKAAQLSLSRAFADSYAETGVLVNAVTPGPVATPLWLEDGGLADQVAAAEGISREEALRRAAEKIPLRRFGEEDEVAAVIGFLSSEHASNVTGAAWSVDGGAVPIIV